MASNKAALTGCIKEVLKSHKIQFQEKSEADGSKIFQCVIDSKIDMFVYPDDNMFEIHVSSKKIKILDSSKANELFRKQRDTMQKVEASLVLEDQHIFLKIQRQAPRRGIFGFDSAGFKDLFWRTFEGVCLLYATLYDDILLCCSRNRTQEEFSELVDSALSDMKVSYKESIQTHPSNFTCTFESNSGESEFPDFTVKLFFTSTNALHFQVWAHNLKISKLRSAESWCRDESKDLPGRGNSWDIEGGFITLNLTMHNLEDELSDEKLKQDIIKIFKVAEVAFIGGHELFSDFCVSTKIKKTELNWSKASEIQSELCAFLLTTEEITATSDRDNVTFQVPSLENNQATVTIVPSTSTLFLYLTYKEKIPKSKRSKIMSYIGKSNARAEGFLDLDLDSGGLRFCWTVPRVDKLPVKTIVQQTFYSAFRSSIVTCRELFADVEEMITGIRPNLNPPQKRTRTSSNVPASAPAPKVVEKTPTPVPSKPLPNSVKVVGAAQSPTVKTTPSSPQPTRFQTIDPSFLTKGDEIGKGGMARVFDGTFCGSRVAIKQLIPSPDMTNTEQWELVQKEIGIHASLSHPNVVVMHGVSLDEKEMSMIVMEHCDKGSLLDTLLGPNKSELFDIAPRRQIAKDICSGMIYLHAHNIFHGDLKPQNVLITGSFRAKVSDFGLSKRMTSASQLVSISGHTMLYAAPEVFDGGDEDSKVSSKADVYPFAFILHQLLTLKNPFADLGKNMMKPYTHGWRPSLNCPEINDPMKKLIAQCWDKDPDNRPSFEEIFSQLDQM
jgi:tRNA A-37 threonylcarbamoyl transferase component Bud32